MPDDNTDIRARVTSWDFIIKNQLCCLPVDISGLCFQHGIKLLSYHKFSSITGHSMKFITDKYSDDGFCLFFKGNYSIVYNSAHDEGSIRCTLAHELAHIMLGHIGPDLPYLKWASVREGISDEQQADKFAGRILCPSVVLHFCGVSSPGELTHLCGVDKPMGNLRWEHLQFLRKKKRFLQKFEERQVLSQFIPFISDYNCEKHTCL